MSDVNDRIIRRLEKERNKRGMSRSGFARSLGMAVWTYRNMLERRTHITAEMLYEVAGILKVPIAEFFEGDE